MVGVTSCEDFLVKMDSVVIVQSHVVMVRNRISVTMQDLK